MSTPIRTCEACKKKLLGRVDQRFCNDTCRNQYNRQKRAAEKIADHENTAQIFRIIKRNYELLKRGRKQPYEENETGYMDTKDFIAIGINPRFCTSSFLDENGELWRCMFDRCFTMGDKITIISDFPDQAEI